MSNMDRGSNTVSKGSALFVIVLSSFLMPFMASSVYIAIPSIGSDFGTDAVLLGWIPTSYLLASAIFLVPFGRIADIHGRRKIFVYGISIYTLSSLLSAFSTSTMMLIFIRVIQGLGGAMIFGTGVAIITSVFPHGERGKALGINVSAVYSGLSMGPFMGGFLTQHFGWRSIFLVNVPLCLIILSVVLSRLKGEWAEAKGEKFDLTGSILYSIALSVTMFGLSLLPAKQGIWLILTGILSILTFIWWEMKTDSPIFDVAIFKNNSVFTFSNIAALINYSATFAVSFLLSLYLQYIKGLSPQDAGLVLVTQPVVMAIFSPYAGRLSDRIEPRIVASIGMGFTTIGLFSLAFLNEETGLKSIVLSLISLGLGLALFSSPNMNAVMGSVKKRLFGVASATLGTMRLSGQMLSMGIALLIFTIYLGRVQITPENYSLFLSGVKAAFFTFTVFCFGGIFASLARGKVR